MKAVIEITEKEAKEILSGHFREKGYKFDEIKIQHEVVHPVTNIWRQPEVKLMSNLDT